MAIPLAQRRRLRTATRARARTANAASLLLELAGLAGIAWGLWTLAPWVGKVAVGLALLAAGALLDPGIIRRRDQETDA